LKDLEKISAYTESTDKNVEAFKKYPLRDTVPLRNYESKDIIVIIQIVQEDQDERNDARSNLT
jgi:hypothetical protein